MKSVFNISLLIIVLVAFSFCASNRSTIIQLEKEFPFDIKKATYQEWVAGVQGGGSGIIVKLTIKDLDSTIIVLDSIYFRNMQVKIKESNSMFVGSFKTRINERKDMVLHKNGIQEYGNKAPEKQKFFPFELANDEAIISYLNNKKLNYFKITLTKEESPKYQ